MAFTQNEQIAAEAGQENEHTVDETWTLVDYPGEDSQERTTTYFEILMKEEEDNRLFNLAA